MVGHTNQYIDQSPKAKNAGLILFDYWILTLIPAAEVKTYAITHTTGIGEWDAGNEGENYFYTLVGTEGETFAHTCSANRKRGQIGNCTFEDQVHIGELKAVRIKSTVKDGWAIVDLEVGIDGLNGLWRFKGNTVLGHEGKVSLNLQKTSRCISE